MRSITRVKTVRVPSWFFHCKWFSFSTVKCNSAIPEYQSDFYSLWKISHGWLKLLFAWQSVQWSRQCGECHRNTQQWRLQCWPALGYAAPSNGELLGFLHYCRVSAARGTIVLSALGLFTCVMDPPKAITPMELQVGFVKMLLVPQDL